MSVSLIRPILCGLVCLFAVTSAALGVSPCLISTPGEVGAKPLTSLQPTTSGKLHVLILFAKFAGEAPDDTTAPPYAAHLFDPVRPGSFSHFYETMSFGQLQVLGTVLDRRYPSVHPAAFYLRPDSLLKTGDFGRFNREVLRVADRDVDFGTYDNDGPDNLPNSGDDDGIVDFLFVNLRSVPEGFFVRRATGISTLGLDEPFLTDDPAANGGTIRIAYGTTQQTAHFVHCVGTMAHEFGHVLGLPDLFDVSFLTDPDQPPEEDSAGIGRWGLMGHGTLGWYGDDGPTPFCAWSREQLGWIGRDNRNLVLVTDDLTDVAIDDVETGGKVFKLPVGPEEYFLVENRQPGGGYYDRNIPAGGLLIWHVSGGTNANERHKRVDLECADGLRTDDDLDFWAHDETYRQRHGGNLGDGADPFDGVRTTSFSLTTNPSSADHLGFFRNGARGVAVTDIHRRGATMRADLRVDRWAGQIDADVTWSGVVHVVGDLTVGPDASLTILPGTEVRFAADDELQTGTDPGRCELHVRGYLSAVGTPGRPILFTAADPDAGDWHGILAHPEARGLNLAHYSVEQAARGLYRADAPPAVEVHDYALFDRLSVATDGLPVLGDGDGRASPGEVVGFGLTLKNRTFTPVSHLRVSARLDDSWATFYDGTRRAPPFVLEDRVASWATAVVTPPALRLVVPSHHPADRPIAVYLEITDGAAVWRDTLVIPVNGADSTPPAVHTVVVHPQLDVGLHPVHLKTAIFEAGSLDSVVAEIRSADSALVALVPLYPEGTGALVEQHFSGTWTPSAAADLHVGVLAIDVRGNATASGPLAGMTTRRFDKTASLLLVDATPPGAGSTARSLRETGWQNDHWNEYYRGPVDSLVLGRFGGGDVLLWSSELSRRLEPHLRAYMDRGGNLLIARHSLLYAAAADRLPSAEFVRRYLHAENSGFTASDRLSGIAGGLLSADIEIAGLAPFADSAIPLLLAGGLELCTCGHNEDRLLVVPRSFFVGSIPEQFPLLAGLICTCGCGGLLFAQETPVRSDLLVPLPPAVPLLADAEGDVVALRVDTGVFRVVYFGFHPGAVADPDQRAKLLTDALTWLAPRSTVDSRDTALPASFYLSQNYPNPFNASTLIPFQLSIPATVHLILYDLSGQTIRTLLAERLPAGYHTARWDGRDARGRVTASGVYLYRLQSGARAFTRRLVLVR